MHAHTHKSTCHVVNVQLYVWYATFTVYLMGHAHTTKAQMLLCGESHSKQLFM